MSIPCAQTGCPGHYVDGYCDFCGFPQPEGSAPTAYTVPTATAESTSAAEHARPDAAGSSAAPPASASPTGPTGSSSSAAAAAAPSAAVASSAVPAAPSAASASSAALPDEQAAVVLPRAGGPGRPRRSASRSVALGTARGTGATRRVGPGRRSRRARLGAGLTTVPPVPVEDPAEAVMADPVVPESRRFCPSCGAEVGRSHGGSPGRTEGYCPRCRNPFSFTPKLRPGDLVAGQYEVTGALAHGGLGWIYLARDRNVSDRWVVLKGLLNAGDADALAAAAAEQEFLARVEHPLIVEVYNVVAHAGAAYTVMEYVGGTGLKQLLKDRMTARGGAYDPLPIDHALAFVLEILPAFAYLHDLGLLYCDFKPDNLIQVGDGVKLIDLGGMRRIDDLDSPIYGTVGYQAPEIAELGPSVASDIYTIGRTLAVLTTEFRGYQTRYATSLPSASQVPAFRASDPFYRLVAKACALDPADRFVSIEELRGQLLGVLRQVVSDRRGVGAANQSGVSVLFDVPVVTSDVLGWWHLPALKSDELDPMAGRLQSLEEPDPERRLARLTELVADSATAATGGAGEAPGEPGEVSAEVLLETMRTALALERHDTVHEAADRLLTQDPWDWRALWVLGLDALARDDVEHARESFEAVYAQVPGEIAPRLAIALAEELAGDHAEAERSYLTCLRTDSAYVTAAAFGVARLRAARDDMHGAITPLELVPPTSGAYPRARWLRAELAVRAGGWPAYDEALTATHGLQAEPRQRAAFTVRVFERALAEVRADGDRTDLRIGGVPATRRALRAALERAYRALASLTLDEDERYALVDQANHVRGWSLL